ncbi:PKD domain-containing protein [Marinimicrobium locisalis]|uniref:PKD domain-containing protein n=1 Tax=Marinimicrobium locisalis TaxID=546022 RepID=UPI003221D2CD
MTPFRFFRGGVTFAASFLVSGLFLSHQVLAESPLASSLSSASSSSTQSSVSSEPREGSLQCEVTSESVWSTGFVYSFAVTNTGNTPVDGWEVTVALSHEHAITNSWGAEISRGEEINGAGPEYQATHKPWSRVIGAGQSAYFGIQGSLAGSFDSEPVCFADRPEPQDEIHSSVHGPTVFVDALGYIESLSAPEAVTINWGDGHSVNGAHEAWHTYFFPGTYEVSVSVETASGTESKTLEVEAGQWEADGNHAPVAVLAARYSYRAVSADKSLSGDIDGDPLTFEQYSVNSAFAYPRPSASASSSSVAHSSGHSSSSSSFSLGSFNDVLTVTDGELGDTTQKAGQAVNGYIDFPGDPRPLFRKRGLTLYVDASDSRQTTSLRWFFGDGTMSEETVTSHTYDEPGVYEVRLSTTGSGFSDLISVDVRMGGAENTAPSAEFSCSDTGAQNGGWVSCTPDQLYDADGDVLKYEWDLGDGTELVRTSTTAGVRHQFEVPGTYEITLHVSDGEADDQHTWTLTIPASAED